VLIISLRSGAGIDGLQGFCRTAVFGELDWSPGVHEQCVGRIHRDGQDDPCVAYFLVAEDGADPVMVDVLGIKREQIEGVRNPNRALVERVDTGENNIRRLAREFLKKRGEKAGEETALSITQEAS
jgi:SNF2 family DNA or RNA helicase